MRPDRHYRQHHDVAEPQVDAKAFRQGWRVSTRLDGLLRDDLIDAATWQAAADFRVAFERAFGVGLGASGELRLGRSVAFDRYSAGKLDAAKHIREIKAALGQRSIWLIERCVLDDLPWRDTAAKMRPPVSDKTARAWTAEALLELSRLDNRSDSALPVVLSRGIYP